MNKYYFLYLFWALPAYFLFLALYQVAVYNGLNSTYNNGNSYIAKVINFEIDQVAAQTSGSAVLRFQTNDGETKEKFLSLPTNVTSRIGEEGIIPIRYEEGAFIEVVIMSTYEMQKEFVLTNVAMAGVAFIITFFVAFTAHRKANKKLKEGEQKMVIERVD